MTSSPLPVLFLTLSSLSTLSAAYTWNFASPPKQCSDLTVSLEGSGASPPYRLLVLPFGATPLSSGVEVRKILDIPFPNGSTSLTFPLNYPANSQLVAVVSDSNGFGSGGTSAAAQVTTSSDKSCFNTSASSQPDFVFSIQPVNQLVQCQDTRIWWDKSKVEGVPNFVGVIPGGESFSVPESNITDVDSQGTGFTWKPDLRAGTTLILVGGDSRGNGSGGSTTNLVGFGTNSDITCLSGSSPSSTAGNPAGGSYPTGAVGGSTGGNGGANAGAIAGGIIGGVAFLAIVILMFWALRRRRKTQKRTNKLRTDVIDAEDDDDVPRVMRQNELPQNYQPEPFMVPIPDPASTEYDDEFSNSGRPLSPGRSSFYSRSETPDLASTLGGRGTLPLPGGGSTGTGGGRKGGPPKPMRAVNIIQHQDAGPSNNEDREEEPAETIELPPAYTMVKTRAGGGPSASTSAGES